MMKSWNTFSKSLKKLLNIITHYQRKKTFMHCTHTKTASQGRDPSGRNKNLT